MKDKGELCLLIVDDDVRIRELAEYAAHRTGFFSRVASASDGHAALEWLAGSGEEERPSVILTDLSMPRLDGLDLVRQLQHEPKWRDIPIAMFSSSNRPNDEELAIAAGCKVFFPKPHGLDELSAIMAAVAELAARPAPAER